MYLGSIVYCINEKLEPSLSFPFPKVCITAYLFFVTIQLIHLLTIFCPVSLITKVPIASIQINYKIGQIIYSDFLAPIN